LELTLRLLERRLRAALASIAATMSHTFESLSPDPDETPAFSARTESELTASTQPARYKAFAMEPQHPPVSPDLTQYCLSRNGGTSAKAAFIGYTLACRWRQQQTSPRVQQKRGK
jgi:hypothetical protein